MLFFVTPKFCKSIFFSFSWELKWPQEKLKTMLMQNFGLTKKEHIIVCYGIFCGGQLSTSGLFNKKLQIRPMERNPRQSWLLDSTSRSPDSRYCISVFVSGTMSHLWLGGTWILDSLRCIPNSHVHDPGLRIPCSKFAQGANWPMVVSSRD